MKKSYWGLSIKYVTLFWPIFTPLPSVTLCHTSRDPPESTSHISEPPRFLVGLVEKTQTKAPCTNSLSIVRGGFCPGGFVRGSFVWKVLSGVVFVHSPIYQNTCYNRKLSITLNFLFHMYDKKMYKCDVTCSLSPHSPCHKLSHLLGPPSP